MSEKSIFERIIDREIPSNIIYEDTKYIAILDISPFEKGHTLVIPKKKYAKFTDMPEDEYIKLQKIVLKISKHYKIELKKNIGTLIFGEDIQHVHIHIFPITKELEVFKFNNTKKYLKNESENLTNKLKVK